MIPNIGPLEIAALLILLLIIFGPKKIPQLGRSLGRGITEFRDGVANRRSSRGDAAEVEASAAGLEPTPKAAREPEGESIQERGSA